MFDEAQRPPIGSAPLSLILLASGPTSDIAESVSAWNAYLATLERPFEVILLQATAGAGSAEDGTNAVLAGVRCIAQDPAVGFGHALHTAVVAAQFPLIALATADRQFAPADLQHLLKQIDHVDLAVGCRAVAGPSAWRIAVGRAVGLLGRVVLGLPQESSPCIAGATPWRRRWAARWALGVRLLDPESPFRLGRREALVRIVLQSHGTFALVEQLAKANHLELIMTEEPVGWTPPAAPLAETVPFAQELRRLFRDPDFGPPALHIPPPANPSVVPTNPAPPSS